DAGDLRIREILRHSVHFAVQQRAKLRAAVIDFDHAQPAHLARNATGLLGQLANRRRARRLAGVDAAARQLPDLAKATQYQQHALARTRHHHRVVELRQRGIVFWNLVEGNETGRWHRSPGLETIVVVLRADSAVRHLEEHREVRLHGVAWRQRGDGYGQHATPFGFDGDPVALGHRAHDLTYLNPWVSSPAASSLPGSAAWSAPG